MSQRTLCDSKTEDCVSQRDGGLCVTARRRTVCHSETGDREALAEPPCLRYFMALQVIEFDSEYS